MFYYNGGCYVGPSGATNHSVVLCGWDDDACYGNGAWLIKNSWGTSWGGPEDGFGWIQYGSCSIASVGGDGIQYVPFPDALVAYASHEVLDRSNGAIDPDETAEVIEKYVKQEPEFIAKGLKKFVWNSASEQKRIMSDQGMYPQVDFIGEFLRDSLGKIEKIPDYRQWVRLDLLPEE